jgi:hypothetical protein
MTIESVTYADLAGRSGSSREAARSPVRRLRLPRQTANDGTVRVNVDLAEMHYKPAPSRAPCGHRADALKAQIEQLQAEVKAIAAGHRSQPAAGNQTAREGSKCVQSMTPPVNKPRRPRPPKQPHLSTTCRSDATNESGRVEGWRQRTALALLGVVPFSSDC